jgi:DNA-directed RNA polymerase beta' subunit
MRIYLRNSFAKKDVITTNQVVAFVETMRNSIIRGIDGIYATYIKEIKQNRIQDDGSIKPEKIYYIFTQGTNLKKVLENQWIDPDTVSSDSIVETYEMFGIGAAREKIIVELKHQIENMNHRHYSIYADNMCVTGVVSSVDRYGSTKRNSSVLLRASDASPISVLENGAIDCATDNLSGVSPSIMIGANPRIGDLYNTFKLDEKFIAENVKNLDTLLDDL